MRRRSRLPQRAKRRPRVVVDTSVLVAGISGFREPYVPGKNPGADLLHRWAEKSIFLWLVTEDVLDEYKEVLKRVRVRPDRIGTVINLIRERAEAIDVRSPIEISPDPKDDAFCLCAEHGKADFIVTLNPEDFPQDGSAQRSFRPAVLSSEAILPASARSLLHPPFRLGPPMRLHQIHAPALMLPT